MTIVKIINGIYGYRPIGKNVVIPTTQNDPPIGVEDEEAKRLVEIGVARYLIEEPEKGRSAPLREAGDDGYVDNSPASREPAEGTQEATGDTIIEPGELKGKTISELRQMAEEMGLDISGLKKKDDIINVICGLDEPNLTVEDVVE